MEFFPKNNSFVKRAEAKVNVWGKTFDENIDKNNELGINTVKEPDCKDVMCVTM